MKSILITIVLLVLLLLVTSCDKGYEIRFTNYYTEPMDSVIIGNNKVVFTQIEFKQTTDYQPIKKGKYHIVCVTKTKKRFYEELVIPAKGNGKRTVQIDAIQQIVVLED